MIFLQILFSSFLILTLAGCYIGSQERLVSRSESLSVLPTRTEGELDGKRVIIEQKRGDSHYTYSVPDDPDVGSSDLVVFDVGSNQIYGAQAFFNSAALYMLIRPRMEETVQIDILKIELDEDEIDALDVPT